MTMAITGGDVTGTKTVTKTIKVADDDRNCQVRFSTVNTADDGATLSVPEGVSNHSNLARYWVKLTAATRGGRAAADYTRQFRHQVPRREQQRQLRLLAGGDDLHAAELEHVELRHPGGQRGLRLRRRPRTLGPPRHGQPRPLLPLHGAQRERAGARRQPHR